MTGQLNLLKNEAMTKDTIILQLGFLKIVDFFKFFLFKKDHRKPFN